MQRTIFNTPVANSVLRAFSLAFLRANGWTIPQTGTTTARPPMTPVALGALAGQHLEPVQRTPVHDWHVANGAKLMAAGLWLRIVQDVQARHAASVPFGLLCLLQRTPRPQLARAVARYFADAAGARP